MAAGPRRLHTTEPDDLAALVDDAVALARRWLAATELEQTKAELAVSGRLAALVGDPAGLDLAVRFVDRVARPEDARVAGRELATISSATAAGFLGWTDRQLLRIGSHIAPIAPRLVVPLARRRLRQLVGHLVVDAHDPALAEHLVRARRDGFRLNVNLLGEAVLGEAEAAARAARTTALLERADVDYVSIKVSALVSQISTWDTEGTVYRVLERLRPLYRAAMRKRPHAFVNLDMEEYRDLDVTIEAFTSLLAEPEFHELEAGIVLQAYLPDSVAALERLIAFAERRVASRGAGIKVRLVKGANLSMERVDAELHGWTPATYATKAEVDANYLRLVDRLLRPELLGAVRVGVASHNLYAVAFAHVLARQRGASASLDVEMLQGMSPAQARAVQAAVGTVLLYTPVVAQDDFDVAVAYLVRRLEENAQPQNFLYALFAGEDTAPGDRRAVEGSMADQELRFRASVAAMSSTSKRPRRTPVHPHAGTEFANTTDSDPALPAVRQWAAERVAAAAVMPTSPVLTSSIDVDRAVATSRAAHLEWARRPAADRAAILRRAADELEARRGDLVTVMAAEGGKTVAEADPEVSEAIDFARYYADRALDLDPAGGHASTDGARFVPTAVTLVTPPWNFPVAIPIGGALAALAAGSAVILKPAPPVPACAEVAAAAVHAALAHGGAAVDVLQVVRTDEGDVGRALVSHRDIDTVLLTGSIETARLFASWRTSHDRGPRVYAETSGKNAVVITPAADFDLAVTDLVKSAFGHAGQKCSAASLVILVGSAGRSHRLRRQLVDAVGSVRVGWPTSLDATMGPLIELPTGKLARALTTLEVGEEWLVEPQQLDATGRLWSPGLKDGVAPGSFFHLTECFGPVLGVMRADTLADAVTLQNSTPFGLTGGLHSLDEDEIEQWLDSVQVGNAYVNRHITGAIVQRQPFGGWKDSVVGPGAKAGGPNYVAQLGEWVPERAPAQRSEPVPRVCLALADYIELIPSESDQDWLRAAVGSDAAAWSSELGQEIDRSVLAVESNVLRYRPMPAVTVRAGLGASPVELVRLLLAAELTGTTANLSLDPTLATALGLSDTSVDGSARPGVRRLNDRVAAKESAEEFVARVRSGAVTCRVRVVGDEGAELPGELAGDDVTVLAGPVLATGRRELLGLLREQAISRTQHRFGHVSPDRQP
jgi:RHH-type proline utilization regulon transcriptional repressor/proline dehydrogenase/delta 1-pyrroline-5-carboxylate dehydrogenase